LHQLRADANGQSSTTTIDLKDRNAGVPEALVLCALLPAAVTVSAVVVDGTPLPVHGLLGRAEPLAEDSEARNEAIDGEPEVLLSSLDLSKNNLGVASAAFVSSALQTNTVLTALNLNNNALRVEGATMLARGLAHNSTLVSLGVSWNRLGPEGLAQLCMALLPSAAYTAGGMHQSASSLTTLYCAHNEVCGINSFGQGSFCVSGLQALSVALSMTALCSVDLGSNSLCGVSSRMMGTFTGEGMHVLASALRDSHIATLTLDGNPIGSEGCSVLASALARHETLSTLSVADCSLTDNGKSFEGLQGLVQTLRTLRRLDTLFLDGNALGSKGSRLLIPWLQSSPPTLTSLHVERGSNALDDEVEQELRTAIGRDVMLHLERSAPAYDQEPLRVSVDGSGDTSFSRVGRRPSVAGMSANLRAPSTASALGTDPGHVLSPSPPAGQKGLRAHASSPRAPRHRLAST